MVLLVFCRNANPIQDLPLEPGQEILAVDHRLDGRQMIVADLGGWAMLSARQYDYFLASPDVLGALVSPDWAAPSVVRVLAI